MPLTLTSNIDAVMARFSKLSVALPVATRGALATTAVEGEAIAVEAIKKNTPVGDEPQTYNPETGTHEAFTGMYQHLQDTTEGTTVVGGTTATIIVRQKKTVDIQGEPYPLAVLLASGHASAEIVPVTKQALFWPGAGHPVKRVMSKAAEPNPYVDQATAEVIPLIALSLVQAGRDALRAAMTAV